MKAEQFFRHSLTITLYPSECVAAMFSSATYSLLQYLSVNHSYSFIHISFPVLDHHISRCPYSSRGIDVNRGAVEDVSTFGTLLVKDP